MQVKCLIVCLALGLLMLATPVCEARRGRGRGRTKSRVQIGLPITGKYRDPESDQYYNNNNVSEGEICWSSLLTIACFRAPKSYKPRTSILSTFWATRSPFCAWPRAIPDPISPGTRTERRSISTSICTYTNGASATTRSSRRSKLTLPHRWTLDSTNAPPTTCTPSIGAVLRRISPLPSTDRNKAIIILIISILLHLAKHKK